MQFRSPSADAFGVAVSVLAGGCAGVVAAALGGRANAAVLGVVVAGVVLVAVEQVPDAVDRAVDARLYLPLGGAALAPLFGDVAGDALGHTVVPDAVAFPAAGFGFLGLVVVEAGRRRRVEHLQERELVHRRVAMTESSRRLFVLSGLSTFVGAAVVRALAGEAVGVPLLVGVGGVTLVGLSLLNTTEVDVLVLDLGLVVVPKRRFGASVVPWRRVRRVSVDDRTLRIERGLPWPTRYERTFAEASEARQLRATLRRYRRAG
jgi:hypothetical protein